MSKYPAKSSLLAQICGNSSVRASWLYKLPPPVGATGRYLSMNLICISLKFFHTSIVKRSIRPGKKFLVSRAFPAEKSCRQATFYSILFFGGCGLASTTPISAGLVLKNQSKYDQSLSLSQSIVCCSIAIREAILKSQMTARDWQG